ncbi:hypothetical protein Rhe02_97400 [Rhizocola hellebori]|uniref:Uncharacterized protein n=1 Tax=Rhizocola hellebori TaxID=1392758 RepID=A0A8J3QIT2_9ACTN|nr:hypothetical protein [Rhizocola hellebori]GIH11673.1 hypothetical protein Rhe02_97400 [Rhizocola hellebori]
MLLAFEPHEWELLTRLPARVMIAAASTEPDSDRRTVDEGLAGINAIAAGASSESNLVKAAVSAIYAEADPDPPTAEQFRDSVTGMTEVFVSCRAAALVLDARATPADALAYRQWVESIADKVCGAARPSEALGLDGGAHSAAEQEFLHQLIEALRNS